MLKEYVSRFINHIEVLYTAKNENVVPAVQVSSMFSTCVALFMFSHSSKHLSINDRIKDCRIFGELFF